MRTFGRMRRRMVGGVSTAAALAAVGVLAPAAGAQVALPTPCPAPVVAAAVSTVTCAFTGTAQTWTVPAGVTSAMFDLFGASGGNGNFAGAGGAGGETTATIAVVAGATYQVMVGDGTYLNGVTIAAAGAISGDTAASFDGVNDSVRVPDSNSLDVGDSFTLEGWIKRARPRRCRSSSTRAPTACS